MRYVCFILFFLAPPVWAMERVPPALVEELSPPPVDVDGCPLAIGEEHKVFDETGKLVECGMYLNGAKEGYWVRQANTNFIWHGRYRGGKDWGTWLITSPTGVLVGVFRFDGKGQRHGVSYAMEPDGRLAWHQVHAHGSKLLECKIWEWPC